MNTDKKENLTNQEERDQLKEFVTQEKTSLGGEFNSGVTSQDDTERTEIEKKGAMANIDQSGVRVEESNRRSPGGAE